LKEIYFWGQWLYHANHAYKVNLHNSIAMSSLKKSYTLAGFEPRSLQALWPHRHAYMYVLKLYCSWSCMSMAFILLFKITYIGIDLHRYKKV
jgi:hypothetical protein